MSHIIINRIAMPSLCMALIPILSLVAGCSSANTNTLRVSDVASGNPVSGITVERYRPASQIEKLFNPVGTTYHPLTLVQSAVTDTNGMVTFSRSSQEDVYRVYSNTSGTLDIAVAKYHVKVTPDKGESASLNWVYSVWIENGKVRHLAEPVK